MYRGTQKSDNIFPIKIDKSHLRVLKKIYIGKKGEILMFKQRSVLFL